MQSVDAHPFVQVVVVDLDGAIEGAGHACGDVLIAWTFEQGPEFQPVSVSSRTGRRRSVPMGRFAVARTTGLCGFVWRVSE